MTRIYRNTSLGLATVEGQDCRRGRLVDIEIFTTVPSVISFRLALVAVFLALKLQLKVHSKTGYYVMRKKTVFKTGSKHSKKVAYRHYDSPQMPRTGP